MTGHIDIDGTYHGWPSGRDRWCPAPPYCNAEDDSWFDRMVMFILDDRLYAASENGLFKYHNGVDRTLRYGFTSDGAFGLIDFPECETYERNAR